MKLIDAGVRLSISFLRPAPIGFEWLFLEDSHIIANSYPAVMLALALSSIPVHKKLYQVKIDSAVLAEDYKHKLIIVIAFFLIILFATLKILTIHIEIILIVCSWFLVEKISDEFARAFTYTKNLARWVITQTTRSLWLLPPLILALIPSAPNPQRLLFFYSMLIFLIILLKSFVYKKWNWRFLFDTRNYREVLWLSPYLSSSALAGLVRQGPRLVVNIALPEISHLYIVATQFSQSIQLMYNVIFHIPYRKIISKRPFLYFRRVGRVNVYLEAVAAVLLISSFLLLMNNNFLLGLVLGVISESILFAIMSNKLILLIWVVSPKAQVISVSAPLLLGPSIYMLTGYFLQAHYELAYFFVIQGALIKGTTYLIDCRINGEKSRYSII